MIRLLCPLVMVLAVPAIAQDFNIRRVELAGNKVNLYYDLLDSVRGRTYTVALYSSRDNFVSRLEKVSGDVGLEVRPGGNRKISWSAAEELGSTFNGPVALEVRGRVYIPFIRVEGLNRMYKRGKEYPITWRGGTLQNILNFDLYRGEEKIHPFSNLANVGQATIKIPGSVKPRKNYYFRITDSRNSDQVVITSRFKVRRKVPLLMKMIPFAAIRVIYQLLSGDNGGPANIPDPLPPPSGN